MTLSGDPAREDGEALYVGQNLLVRWWPTAAIGIAALQASIGLFGAAALCAALALLFATLIPWRFAVTPNGIALWFGLGKRRFPTRDQVVVQCERGGATVRRRCSRRFGYPLPERLGTFHHTALRAALTECNFQLTG